MDWTNHRKGYSAGHAGGRRGIIMLYIAYSALSITVYKQTLYWTSALSPFACTMVWLNYALYLLFYGVACIYTTRNPADLPLWAGQSTERYYRWRWRREQYQTKSWPNATMASGQAKSRPRSMPINILIVISSVSRKSTATFKVQIHRVPPGRKISVYRIYPWEDLGRARP